MPQTRKDTAYWMLGEPESLRFWTGDAEADGEGNPIQLVLIWQGRCFQPSCRLSSTWPIWRKLTDPNLLLTLLWRLLPWWRCTGEWGRFQPKRWRKVTDLRSKQLSASQISGRNIYLSKSGGTGRLMPLSRPELNFSIRSANYFLLITQKLKSW